MSSYVRMNWSEREIIKIAEVLRNRVGVSIEYWIGDHICANFKSKMFYVYCDYEVLIFIATSSIVRTYHKPSDNLEESVERFLDLLIAELITE